MSTDLTPNEAAAALLERVVVGGDLSKLSSVERLAYYRAVCDSVGLNPLTRPFDYLTLNSRLVLYAKRDATDQLRRIHGVSVHKMESARFDDLFVVTAYARNQDGREDSSTGAVSIAGLKGEALANAIMKAETKAKRRVTLSLCGLGLLDETEVPTIPEAVAGGVDLETGELRSIAPVEPPVPEDAARSVLIDRIEMGMERLALRPSEQLALAQTFCGMTDWRRAEGADLARLLGELVARYKAQQSGKK